MVSPVLQCSVFRYQEDDDAVGSRLRPFTLAIDTVWMHRRNFVGRVCDDGPAQRVGAFHQSACTQIPFVFNQTAAMRIAVSSTGDQPEEILC